MAIPMRQSARIGWYLFNAEGAPPREVPADRRAGAAVRLQPQVQRLRQDPAAARAAAPADAGRAGGRRDRGVRRADGVDRRRRAADAPADRRHGQRARQAQEVRLPVHQRRAGPQALGQVRLQAVAVLLLRRSTSTGCASGTTSRWPRRACSTRPIAAIKFLKEKGFRVTTNSTFFNTDTPQTVIDVLNFLNDEVKVDEMMISPAYAYEKAPDQDHFLGRRPRPASCSARRSPTATASAGGSTTRRCSSTSSRARSTSSAPRGASRPTRCSAGSGRAT